MSDLEAFLSTSKIIWHGSLKLINKFGMIALNELYREGINEKVVMYKK